MIRAFTNDFETIVPKYESKDFKAYCYLYVGIKNRYRDYDSD